jgi:3',5'-cyclic AMP phosphodiesterase CpdA
MIRALTLFHVSDLHFGAEDRAALAWFAHEVATHRPDAVICTGDLTMRARPREFAAAAEWFARLDVPVTIEPGNHDIPYYWDPLRRLRRPYARYRAFEGAIERALALPGLAVVPLHTVARAQWRLNWSKGHVARASLGHALAGLGAHDDTGLRLVACHHPLVEANTAGTASTRGGKAALAALAQGGAHAVLSGHVHDAFDLTVSAGGHPIRLIGAGTLSQRLRATAPSYNRLEWSPDAGLSVAVQRLR